MGYTTDFFGEFTLDKPLEPEHKAYLEAFANTRRMKRDPEIAEKMPDPLREAVELPIGSDGCYFVGEDDGKFGQTKDGSIVDYNQPPGLTQWDSMNEDYDVYLTRHRNEVQNGAQPGLWCQWVPNEDGTAIVWDEGEKFYDYVAWLNYLIKNFLELWGYTLNGAVSWQGEDPEDCGTIHVKNNVVLVIDYGIISPAAPERD